jgi:hypothetical protein
VGDLRNVFLLLLSLTLSSRLGGVSLPLVDCQNSLFSSFFLVFLFLFGFHSWKKADVNVDLIIYSVRDSGCPVSTTPLSLNSADSAHRSAKKGQFLLLLLFLFSSSSYGLFICVCNHDRYQRTKGAPLGSLSFYCLLSRIKQQQIKTLENAKMARGTSHI